MPRDAKEKSCHLPTWDKDVMQAASMSVGSCAHGGTVGIDMLARDGSVFAHGHFDIDVAIEFGERLTQAIAEAIARAN